MAVAATGMLHFRRTSAVAAAARSEPLLRMMLTSGGDERIAPDPLTGRNRYGTTTSPERDEIWLASSTAGAITPAGWSRCLDAVHRLVDCGTVGAGLPAWFA